LQKISDAKTIKKNSSEYAAYKDYEDLDHEREVNENPLYLSDWQCLLAVSTLKCFSLEKKVWCKFQLYKVFRSRY
jgi:hypothetical protein